jgi:hypothetical protein
MLFVILMLKLMKNSHRKVGQHSTLSGGTELRRLLLCAKSS